MNTNDLRQKFKPIYTDFFSRCSFVVSAPHSFLWSGDFAGFYGGLTISSKIPLRFYVGIEETGGDKIEIPNSLLAYFAESGKFKAINIDANLKKSILESLSGHIKGIKLHLLSEVPLGSSLGGLGALAACLTIVQNNQDTRDKIQINLKTQIQKINSTVQQYDNPKSQKLEADANYNAKDLFPLAWEIAKKLQTGRTLGATAYTALADSNYPIVFDSEKDQYRAKSLDQITEVSSEPVWPIDFGLIYSGKLVQGAAVIASAEEIKRISIERETQLDFSQSKSSFWNDYINFLKQITNQNLYAMNELFAKGAHENTLKFFFNTLNQYQNLLHFLEISNYEIDKIYAEVHRIANISDNRVGSGAKITGVGKGGMVLFALPYGQYRNELEKKYKNSLIYASWRDGCETRGTMVEQDVHFGRYSEFIDKNSYRLTIFSSTNTTSKLVSQNEIDKLDFDLIIDSYHKKIIIPGKNLSSKDLPSQKSAAIIISQLLSVPNHHLSNNQLPVSYASSRFDLQSKITTPISKLAPIDFEISGEMYDKFTLKLKSIRGKIGVLEKI